MGQIKIGWKTYEIMNASPDTTLTMGGEECYGQIDYDKNRILLNNEFARTDQGRATLVHEIIHGISHMYHLDLDEAMVERLGDALFTVIKDNGIQISLK